MTRWWWFAVALALLAAPSPARADDGDPPFVIGSQPAWYLMGGVVGGGTVALADRGGLVGGELSLARLRDGRWVGLYGDAYHDWGTDGTYLTAGPELGGRFIGLDGGGALRFTGGETQYGATGRLSASVGLFSVFVRYAWFDADEDDHVLQVGAMLKFPLMSPRGGR